MHQAPLNPKQRVLVNVILDKSGSMASKTKDVIEGFNAYLDGLAEEDKVEYLFSLTLFDTQVAYRDVAIPLGSVRKNGPNGPSWFQVPVSSTTATSALRQASPGGVKRSIRPSGSRKP